MIIKIPFQYIYVEKKYRSFFLLFFFSIIFSTALADEAVASNFSLIIFLIYNEK